MKTSLIGIILSAVGLASAGEVRYVPCDVSEALDSPTLYAMAFAVAPEGCGTVSPHAVVAAIHGGSVTPMQIAIDSDTPDGKVANVVRLDFTGAGKFDNVNVIPLPPRDPGAGSDGGYRFGPKVLQVQQGDRSCPASVQGTYYRTGNRRYLQLQLASAAQGQVQMGGRTCNVRIIGTYQVTRKGGRFEFDRAPKPVLEKGQPVWCEPGCTVIVSAGEGGAQAAQRVCYGQPVRMDGKWYSIGMTADGNAFEAKPIDLPTAQVKVNQPSWSCRLVGKNTAMNLCGGMEAVEIPAGEFTVLSYSIPADTPLSDANGAKLRGRGPAVGALGRAVRPTTFPADQAIELKIGPPLHGSVQVDRRGRDVELSLALTDGGGGQVTYVQLPGNKQPDPPKVAVVDAQGKTVFETTLQYG